MSEEDLINHLHVLVQRHGSQKALAEYLGISQAYLRDVLHGRREPGESVLTALGIRRRVAYEWV